MNSGWSECLRPDKEISVREQEVGTHGGKMGLRLGPAAVGIAKQESVFGVVNDVLQRRCGMSTHVEVGRAEGIADCPDSGEGSCRKHKLVMDRIEVNNRLNLAHRRELKEGLIVSCPSRENIVASADKDFDVPVANYDVVVAGESSNLVYPTARSFAWLSSLSVRPETLRVG
jgi:hypothetical protein